MANSMAPETKVGFFALFAGLALLYMSLRTAGYTSPFGPEMMTFTLKFKSVAGLEQRSKVKLSGVDIGVVESVILEDRHAKLIVRMTTQADIKKDAMASIKTSGLLGEKYIELEQGSPEAPLLKDGDNLENAVGAVEVTDLLNKLSFALDDVKGMTTSLRKLTKTLEEDMDIGSIMKNVDEATKNLSEFIKENKELVSASMKGLNQISSDFSKISPQVSQDIISMSGQMRELLEQNSDNLTASLENLNRLSGDMGGILEDNRGNIKEILDSLADNSSRLNEVIDSINRASVAAANTAEDLENITGRIDRGEGSIGKLMTEEKIYDNLNETLASAKSMVTQAEDFGLTVGARTEYQGDQEKWKSFFTVKLSPNADKFYLVEVTEDLRRTDLEGTRNTLNSLLYTGMIGKRFSDVTIRGGVIENSTGLALDLHLFNDNLTASAEVFNFSGYDELAENAQVKAWMKWNFHKYMYIYAGGDELLNDHYKTWFAGGGILFDDNDLKLALSLR